MSLLPTLFHLVAAAFESDSARDERYLSAARDYGDLERRLAQVDDCQRRQASGIVAGLYPR